MKRPPQRPVPTALACGILQDGERILFLKQKDAQGTERIGVPFVLIFAGQDPVKKMTEFFLQQTGIDGHVQEVRFQSTHNAGSRKHRRAIPVLAFRVEAKVRQCRPAPEYSGYAWLAMDAAKGQKLDRMSEWIRTLPG